MSNFEKKLEEATNEELYFWINERNWNAAQLPSEELTRRLLKSLQKTLIDTDKSTKKFNRATAALTIVIMFMTYVQVVIALYEAFGKNGLVFIMVTVVFGIFLILLIRYLDKNLINFHKRSTKEKK